jgi:hypothetical protein
MVAHFEHFERRAALTDAPGRPVTHVGIIPEHVRRLPERPLSGLPRPVASRPEPSAQPPARRHLAPRRVQGPGEDCHRLRMFTSWTAAAPEVAAAASIHPTSARPDIRTSDADRGCACPLLSLGFCSLGFAIRAPIGRTPIRLAFEHDRLRIRGHHLQDPFQNRPSVGMWKNRLDCICRVVRAYSFVRRCGPPPRADWCTYSAGAARGSATIWRGPISSPSPRRRLASRVSSTSCP